MTDSPSGPIGHLEHPDLATLSLYYDEEGPAEMRDGVDRHLASCESCREELSRLESLTGTLADVPLLAAPDSILGGFREGLKPAPTAPTRPLWVGPLSAAALLLLSFGGAWFILGLFDSPPPPSELARRDGEPEFAGQPGDPIRRDTDINLKPKPLGDLEAFGFDDSGEGFLNEGSVVPPGSELLRLEQELSKKPPNGQGSDVRRAQKHSRARGGRAAPGRQEAVSDETEDADDKISNDEEDASGARRILSAEKTARPGSGGETKDRAKRAPEVEKPEAPSGSESFNRAVWNHFSKESAERRARAVPRDRLRQDAELLARKSVETAKDGASEVEAESTESEAPPPAAPTPETRSPEGTGNLASDAPRASYSLRFLDSLQKTPPAHVDLYLLVRVPDALPKEDRARLQQALTRSVSSEADNFSSPAGRARGRRSFLAEDLSAPQELNVRERALDVSGYELEIPRSRLAEVAERTRHWQSAMSGSATEPLDGATAGAEKAEKDGAEVAARVPSTIRLRRAPRSDAPRELERETKKKSRALPDSPVRVRILLVPESRWDASPR